MTTETDTRLQNYIQELEDTGTFKVLRKVVKSNPNKKSDPSKKLHRGVIIDVETTGLISEIHEIINLGMILFTYDEDGNIYNSLPRVDEYQEPKEPISPEITALTHIVQEDVKGKTLNIGKINACLAMAEIVIAHNAGFDRSFIDGLTDISKEKIWCCTQKQIPWIKDFGLSSHTLISCGIAFGFYFDAHKAVADCEATLEILSNTNKNGQPVLKYLLDSIEEETFRLRAIGSPFARNNLLKANGYEFDGEAKNWYKIIGAEKIAKEKAYLVDKIYPNHKDTSTLEKMNRVDLFK